MSEDSGSPTEAAIAERRLKALMIEHDISITEIKPPEQDGGTQTQQDQRTPVRRKRARQSVQWKTPRPSARANRVFALVAMLGFIGALSLWILFTGAERTGSYSTATAPTRQREESPQQRSPILTTQVDRTNVIEGESVVLNINGSGVSAMPDTSHLWQDFKIIGTNVTEGPDSQDYRIRIMLQPLRTGTIFIPSFSAGDARSEMIIINVLTRS